MTLKKPSQQLQSRRTQFAGASADPLAWVLKAIIAALFVARLLVPTETAPEGDTLWIVQLWLAAVLLWLWQSYRSEDFRLRFGWFDLFLWTFIAGHALSAFMVFVDGGNKRAALNVVCEWVGLGATVFLFRQLVTSTLDRQRFAMAFVAVAAALAMFGLWQHYYFYPAQTRKYEATRSELDRLESAERPASIQDARARQVRIDVLRKELTDEQIPLQGPERILWESRLRASSEPFGMFALANSFAGMLLVGALIAVGFLATSWGGDGNRRNRIILACIAGLILYCLVLSKSRTAWLGLAVGGAILAFVALRRQVAVKLSKKWIAFGLLGAVFAFAAASLSGGFDWKVISESSKSLSYRKEYWTGTWNMLRERPLFGAGPGNFRPHYLRFKLAESSEEISDPHNFVLDVWSSGGLLAVVGLAGMIFAAIRTFRKSGPANEESAAVVSGTQAVQTSRNSIFRDPFVAGAAGGFAFVWCLESALAEISPETYRFFALPALLLAYLIIVRLIDRAVGGRAVPIACFAAAGLGLLCHLLGAGGIEMPAIAQMLLVLPVIAAASDEHSVTTAASPGQRLGWRLAAIVGIVAFVVCLQTATLPVARRKAMLQTDPSRSLEMAEASYRKAAIFDPLSPEPAEFLAELEFGRWSLAEADDANRFDEGVDFQQLAISLNPYNSVGYQKLGRRYHEKFRKTHDKADAAKGVEALEQAADLYPTSSYLQAELAETARDAGQMDRANRAAAEAIRLDEINRAAGHRDKYLPDETLQKLRSMPPASS